MNGRKGKNEGRPARKPAEARERGWSVEGKRIAVIGLGVSGRAATRLALEKGGDVYVSDLRTEAEVATAGDELRAMGAWVELGSHRLERIAEADAVVASPGIPPETAVLRELRSRGVGWISEVEFAFRFLDGPLIAITGTNGKTTTASLVAHLLRHAGILTGLGGNIGVGLGPAASDLALLDPVPEWFVVEVSSFQLRSVDEFAPSIGIVTNLAPDHLDWYSTIDDYYRDKARLFENASAASRWIWRWGDEEVARLAGEAAGRRYHFDAAASGFRGAFVQDGVLTLHVDGEEEPLLPVRGLPLLGTHNVENALAASVAARLAGVEGAAIAEGLGSFEPLPHRLDPVADREGVLWVNDSKATNVAATASALRSLDRPIVLLFGGKDKGEDFSRLRPLLDEVQVIVAYGAARLRIQAAFGDLARVIRVDGSFEEAVRAGRTEARPGDILLLAPGCSSFDMFEDYEARGERFTLLARES